MSIITHRFNNTNKDTKARCRPFYGCFSMYESVRVSDVPSASCRFPYMSSSRSRSSAAPASAAARPATRSAIHPPYTYFVWILIIIIKPTLVSTKILSTDYKDLSLYIKNI